MLHSKQQLSLLVRSFVYLVFGVLFLTGTAWMFAQTKLDNERWEHFPTLLLKIHGAAAMIALILLGYLLNHIRIGWEIRKNQTSGTTLVLVYLFLTVTGYGLYYASDENFRTLISQWHSWIGLGVLILLAVHVLIGRTIRLKRNRLRQQEQSSRRASSYLAKASVDQRLDTPPVNQNKTP